MTRTINFTGHGANVAGSLGSGSLVQNMPSAYSFGTANDGYAASFVDCGDRADFEFADGIGFILSAWVKLAKFSDHQFIAGKSNWAGTSHSEYFLGLNNDNRFHWVCNNGTNGGTCQSNDVYNNEVEKEGWNHVMGVRDTSNNLTLYINGVAQTDTETCSGNVGVSSQDFGIGTRNSGGTPDLSADYFRGNIRDVRIYSGTATSTELQEIYKGESPTLAAGSLKGWWKMDGDFNDSSGNGFNGALTKGADSTDYWNKSLYNLNQIDAGNVSGSVILSGGTWNLLESTYLDFNGTDAYCNVPSAASLDEPKTIAFWCKPDQIKGGANNAVSRGSNDYEIYFHSSTNTWWNYWGTKWSPMTGPSVGVGVWQHIVCTLDDTTSPPTVRWYKDGILHDTGQLNGTPVYSDDGALNIGRDASEENDYLDGIIKDVMLYDTKLTDAQVGLLYKGQWIGSPAHWWKLTEGTGNGADSGIGSSTAQTQNTTWVNPDYEIEMAAGGTTFMIEEDTTLSAPRGNLILSGTTTTPTYTIDGIYTHNTGTMVHKNGIDTYFQPSDISKSGVNTFHKVKIEGNKTQWSKGSWNVEDSIHLEGILRLYANSTYSQGHTLTLGKTNSTGYVSGSGYMQAMTTNGTPAGAILQGASKLYPALLSGTHASYKGALSTYRSVQLKDLQFDGKVTNEGSMDSPVVTLVGDTYFKGGYDVHNGEKLVTTNQRAHFGANLDMESGVTFVGSGALLICDDKIKTDGATVYNSGTSVICGHAGESTIRFNDGDWENLMYNPTGGGVSFDTNANVANNLIVAGGYYDMLSAHLSGDGVGTLQIVGGAEFRGGDNTTHKITDTFNSRGGLLGTSALEFNGSSESAANASATTWGFGSSFSIELWFKTSFNGSSCLLDFAESSGNDNRIQVLQTPSEMAFKVWNSGGSSFQIGTTAFTINPDDGKWHHLAFTSDGSTQKIYYDGRLAGEASHTIARDADPTMKLTIGMHATLGSHYSGYMDELRFFSDVRTESELRTDMFQGGTLADSGALVARYKFDEGENTTLANSEGTTARNLTASGDGVWIPAGTFTYDTCTLEFDNNGGTCNLYAPLSGGPTPAVSGLTITSGTTMVINNPGRDFYCYGPLVNSGTTTASHNFQYRNRAMPLVGPNSDLKLGGKIFYYFSDGTANYVASGAGTDYYQMRPGTEVWMQGDFDCQNDLLQSGGELHLNGYTANVNSIMNYGGGDIYADPGSSIAFDSTDGFEKSFGASPTDMLFVASGEAAAMFNWNEAANTGTDNISTAAQHAAGGITLVAWVKNQDGYNKDFFIGRGARDGLGLWNNDRQLAMGIVIGGGDPDRLYSSNAVPGDGEWVHLAGVYDPSDSGNELKIYVSGALVASGATTSTGAISYESSAWLIGGDGDSERYMHGSIADVRIYSGSALSAANIATLYNGGINPAVCTSGAIYADSDNALGATGWWKLGGTSTGTLDLTDYAGSNNGTNNGGRTGFVTISSSATPYNPINNIYPASVTLRNVYMSGSKDIIAGQRRESSAGYMAVPTQVIKTEGTVVLD